MLLLIALSLLIGVLLGLLGGGGSILTVPVLVYLAGLSAKNAIITSLIVVCLTSLIAVVNHARRGKVCWTTGLAFGLTGMIGAFLGGRLAAYVPDSLLLVLFAAIMLAASLSMLRNQKTPKPLSTRLPLKPCPQHLPLIALMLDGFLVGSVTGLIGVGGGFLMVPALNNLAGLPIHAAIGTSLFIIVIQSSAALAGHASHMTIDIFITALFSAFAIIGSFIGSSLSGKISGQHLKRGFGILVFILGCFLLYREINPPMMAQIKGLVIRHQDFILGASTILVIMLSYRLWLWVHTLPKSNDRNQT
ncbi:sulfite exporter TauE/SafE family protein [Methylobacter sp. YRD-M1]|uniref:sulfite exporter TauE/SafE family protein n=1 Tax=Methylobacter sp. YRD-M1 TaxID=2911520 RepID=UPI00227BEAD6|nr:sulfite exporter TauE/SafE family protein [Methylobacter sp. YRD-M1]WAK01511.1 sulfite exporter TauE/SafE family protein [Methylobacter sp. YRD-M1]